MMQHYISLLLKHRRLILSGPSGTGKSYLASRLAEYLVDRSAREVTEGIVVTFNMHRQSCKVTETDVLHESVQGWIIWCVMLSVCFNHLSSLSLSGSAALSFQPGQSNRSGNQHIRNSAGCHSRWYSRPCLYQRACQWCSYLQISQMVSFRQKPTARLLLWFFSITLNVILFLPSVLTSLEQAISQWRWWRTTASISASGWLKERLLKYFLFLQHRPVCNYSICPDYAEVRLEIHCGVNKSIQYKQLHADQ